MSNRAVQSGRNVMDHTDNKKIIVDTTTGGNPDAIPENEAQAQVLNKGMSEVPAASTGEVDPAQAAGEVAGKEESGETKGSAEESQQERMDRFMEAFLQREDEKRKVAQHDAETPGHVATETDLLAQKDDIWAKANERIASLQVQLANLDEQAAKLLEEGETEKYHSNINKQMQLNRDIAREETNAQTQQMYVEMEIREQRTELDNFTKQAQQDYLKNPKNKNLVAWYQSPEGQEWMQDRTNRVISGGNPLVGYLEKERDIRDAEIARLKELEQKYNSAIESEAKDPNKMVGAGSGGKPPTQQIEGKPRTPLESMLLAYRRKGAEQEQGQGGKA